MYNALAVQSSATSTTASKTGARHNRLLNAVSSNKQQPQQQNSTLNENKSSKNINNGATITRTASAASAATPKLNKENSTEQELTWIHELFQGILVNETKCLNCETVSFSLSRLGLLCLSKQLSCLVLVKLKRRELLRPVRRCRTKHVALALSARVFQYGDAVR